MLNIIYWKFPAFLDWYLGSEGDIFHFALISSIEFHTKVSSLELDREEKEKNPFISLHGSKDCQNVVYISSQAWSWTHDSQYCKEYVNTGTMYFRLLSLQGY